LVRIIAPRVGWGKLFNIGKNISIWAKVTQVSDVAHWPLVSSKRTIIKQLFGDRY
jgi:hypothetical protein